MKSIVSVLAVFLFTGILAAQEVAVEKPKDQTQATVTLEQLPDLVLKSGALSFNNFNLVHEEAFFGGYKVTAQVTGKNRSGSDLNYTIYIFAKNYDSKEKTTRDICCFKIEPDLNVHEAGKVETLTDSGMLSEVDFKNINMVRVKLVVQKSE